ncbi:MAG: type ISP restriction/modification enzyme [Rubrivivax sp.]
MLNKDDFIRHILGEAPQAKPKEEPEESSHIEGFDFADDAQDADAAEDTRFVTPLLQAGFGDGQGIPRATVIRSTDAVARHIPDEVRYWPKTPTRPHHTLLIEANLTHRELLAIPAFRSRQLAHLDIAEDAVARLVAEALEGFQRGAEGMDASALKGLKHETLCVVSIVDEREGHAGRLACFGTFNAKTEGLETFFLTEHARTWDRADARERLSLIYERQFKKLGEANWQDAFTTTDERQQAENLLEVCTKKTVLEKDVQESILDLLDTIARGFGLRKKADAQRRLRAFPLPGEHDIGIDAEERDSKYGGTNPFSGVTLRDDHSRLLGYIVYPLKTKSDATKLRQHLELNNRFHNVLVVYPDVNQASIELWQGREQLTGKLRRGQSHKDAADVVNLLSRFFVVSKAKVRNPAELAQELAYRARYLRRLALKQLEDEPDEGPLRNLYNAFKLALVHDQDEDEFADAFAQTITYGLLTARWLGNDQLAKTGDRFTRQNALKYLPAASPFLNDLFKSVLSLKLDEHRGRLLWLVDDVADLLDRIDVTYVFGAGDKGSDTATDPVIHFYEPFLAAYDKELKNKRGVFFTPRPVVSYIARSVHELLQRDFGLEDGLASIDTWSDVAKRIDGFEIPQGIKGSDPFVCILDPATGTGTFIYECIQIIESTMKERWCREIGVTSWHDERVLSRWREYVPAALLPRIFGYELMMASYAVAHLKLSFKLAETGCELSQGPASRLNVYLTNSLESPTKAQGELEGISPALASEASAVTSIKSRRRFTVLIGNPPYANYSANLSPESRAIVDKYRTFRGTPIRERNQLQFERNLQDDFVKFIAIGEEEIRRSSAGVLGYITNATMLASPSLRGMREHLSKTFTDLFEFHLHGGVNEIPEDSLNDQNVFDIAQAVAIHILVRHPKAKLAATTPVVHFSEMWGPRPQKYSLLAAGSALTTEWHKVQPDHENWAFVPHDTSASHESLRVDDIFVRFGAGIKTNRDSVAIAFDKDNLLEAISEFDSQVAPRDASKYVQPILYRPFDKRVIFYHEDVVASRSLPTMQHVLAGPNLGLIASSTWTSPDRFSVNVSRLMVEMKTGTHDRGTTYFPLYRYESILGGAAQKTANLQPDFRKRWESLTRTRLLAKGHGDLSQTTGPEDVLYWIYGLSHSPEYRRRNRAALAQGFPIVLFPKTTLLLADLVAIGKRLAAIHLFEELPAATSGSFIGERYPEVEKIAYADGTVWIDRLRTRGFAGVSEAVWALHIGGYPVCEKWLKDRKGRNLSKAEVDHYVKLIGVLEETLELMKQADLSIAKHGGWPDAFVMRASTS